MNSYGTIAGPQHTLVGRIAPMCEALRLAIHRAAKMPPCPTRYVHTFPQWGHNVANELTKTVFKGLIVMAPKNDHANEANAFKIGQMIGFLVRAAIYFFKEVPAQIDRDGLNKLTPEQSQKMGKIAGLELLSPHASELAGRTITGKSELIKFIRRHILVFAIRLLRISLLLVNQILHRPVAEIFQFLSGLPKGFKSFLKFDGEFEGKRKRTEIYLLMLMYWPEIEEMRQSKTKTRKFLLEWLESKEGKQLVEDPKTFYELCGDIDLDLALPGHPSAAVSG
jgi:hypothetical protein